jgi:hypothetical protein
MSDKWLTIYTTKDRYPKAILAAQVAWFSSKQQVIIPYLGLYSSIPKTDGREVPLDYELGSFRNDKYKLNQHLLLSAKEVSNNNGKVFVVPFIAGNVSTSTSQKPWRDNLARAIKDATGFDCDSVTTTNQKDKSEELQKLLVGKKLDCYWSCWMSPDKSRWFYGPDGKYLAITS